MTPQYLIRIWGRDTARVSSLRVPDAIEPNGVLCYWFHTTQDRADFRAFISDNLMVVSSVVNPGYDHDGEPVDTHALTYARITLRLPDGREGTFDQCFGYGYPEHSVHYMWEDGYYSCDCNRRLFLTRHCDIDSEETDLDTLDVRCGESIELVSLEIYHTPTTPEGGVH